MKLLRSTDIGYSPLSARDRQIKDGSKFDRLFPQPDLKTTLLQRDGEVEDTVKKMQEIVVKYSWQVKELCKRLKASTVRQSVKNVFDFVYDYIKYQVEDGEKLRTPAYSWYEGQVLKRQRPNDSKIGVDCDCMSIFCGCCFKEMNIPFSFRVTGYANALGFCRGFQHVYTVAYDENGKEIICDPVYIGFNKEKEYAIQKTYAMSLNGTDIIMLSGIDDESHHEYVENSDGTVGELAGRKKRKARRKARKEKRKARKAIRKARKKGDKEALKAAKERLKAAKKQLAENRSGFVKAFKKVGKGIAKGVKAVGKGIARFAVATTMQVPRTMFCLLLRLNFRGLATKLANNEKARDKMKKLWRDFGGKTKEWTKAVDKGKNKKPLFGSKKLKGFDELQLQQLGAVLDEWGVLDGATLGDLFTEKELRGLGGLGFATTSVGAAIASAVPIVKKVVDILKKMGDFIPETADEAGEDAITADDDQQIVDTEAQEQEQAAEPEQTAETKEDGDGGEVVKVEAEEVDGFGNLLHGDDVVAYEVVEVEGLGALGAGLFKKLFSGAKKIVSKIKTKRAAKKANKTIKKATRKAQKTIKKATRKAQKTARKTQRKQARAVNIPLNTGFGQKLKNAAQRMIQSETGQQIINSAKGYALQKGGELVDRYTGGSTKTLTPQQDRTPSEDVGGQDNSKKKKSWISEHKAVAVAGGLLLLGGVGFGVYKACSKLKNETKIEGNNGKLQALELF